MWGPKIKSFLLPDWQYTRQKSEETNPGKQPRPEVHLQVLREAASAEFKHSLLSFVPLLPFSTRNPAQGKACKSSNWARLSDPHTHSSCLPLCLGHQAAAKSFYIFSRLLGRGCNHPYYLALPGSTCHRLKQTDHFCVFSSQIYTGILLN